MDDLEPPPWATEFAPADLPTPPLRTDAHATYEYRRGDGSIAFVVCRWEAHNGHAKKSFKQFSLEDGVWVPKNNCGRGQWPLLDLPAVLAHEGPVLLVEGEKTAAAAKAIAPRGWLVTTWAGGSSAFKNTDWTPLHGREVVIWPDNDAPGHTAAAGISALIPGCSIVDLPLDLPDGWDLGDPFPEGKNSAWAQSLIFQADAGPAAVEPEPTAPAAPLTFDPVAWEGLAIPEREWFIKDLVPLHVPTMLSGKGGLGKSLLGVQMSFATALNKPWLGREVTPFKAFAVFSEDDQDELHRRYAALNEAVGTSFGDMENLRLMIRDGEQSSLMDYPNPHEAGTESAFYQTMKEEIKAFGAQFILLDSLYNFFHGNENNRVHVTQFVYLLRRLAKECNAALIFIAHPSKSGLSTGDGYAGSTAWHDAVRARLYLTEDNEDGETRLVLKTMKANYAPREGQIEVFYHKGMLWPKDTPQTETAAHYTEQAEVVFLKCLREAQSQGRAPSGGKTSTNYAPKIFAKMGIASGFRRDDLEKAMERLFNSGKIKTGEYLDAWRRPAKGIYEAVSVKIDDELDL